MVGGKSAELPSLGDFFKTLFLNPDMMPPLDFGVCFVIVGIVGIVGDLITSPGSIITRSSWLGEVVKDVGFLDVPLSVITIKLYQNPDEYWANISSLWIMIQ